MCFGRCNTLPVITGVEAAIGNNINTSKYWEKVQNQVKARNNILFFMKVGIVVLAVMGLLFLITSIISFNKFKKTSSKIITWFPSVASLGAGIYLYYRCFKPYKKMFGEAYRTELENLQSLSVYNNFDPSIKGDVELVLATLPVPIKENLVCR